MKKKILSLLLTFAVVVATLVPTAAVTAMAATNVQAATVTQAKAASKYETGLYRVNGKWKYYENGKFKKVTGVVKKADKDEWLYVKKGVFKKVTGAVKRYTDKAIVYVKNGKFKAVTGVVPNTTGKTFYYVEKGVFKKATGLAKRITDKKWVYVKNGKFKAATGATTKINEEPYYHSSELLNLYYYVRKGVLTKATGVTKCLDEKGKMVFVLKGKMPKFECDSDNSGAFAYGIDDDKIYYVQDYVVNEELYKSFYGNESTPCPVNAIDRNGKSIMILIDVNTKIQLEDFTGIIEYHGDYSVGLTYYKKGVLQNQFNGYLTYQGKTYYFTNGHANK